MLLDEHFPRFDVVEIPSIVVAAPVATVYEALSRVDFARHPLIAALLAIRAAPAALLGRLRSPSPRPIARTVTLATFARQGFATLGRNPPHELLLGLQGRFWTLDGDLQPFDAEVARAPIPPGMARGGWNFTTTPLDATHTRLTTETRVICADSPTRRRFLSYWFVIRLGSGAIRQAMLRQIRSLAENEHRRSAA